jgi:hypothetical protein
MQLESHTYVNSLGERLRVERDVDYYVGPEGPLARLLSHSEWRVFLNDQELDPWRDSLHFHMPGFVIEFKAGEIVRTVVTPLRGMS